MTYFIPADQEIDYKNLSTAKVVDQNGKEVDLARFEMDKASGYFDIIIDDNAMRIREGLWERAVSSVEEQAIKIDFNKQKARRVPMADMTNQTKNGGSASNDIIAFDPSSITIETTKLKDVVFDPKLFEPVKTGTYLDCFLSKKGGWMPGSIIMTTGEPGVGKSSNYMDMLVNIKDANPDKKVLYISAEMIESDVKEFEEYYPGLENIDFLYLGKYVTNPDLNIKAFQALQSVLHQSWDIVVVDSMLEVQSMVQEDLNLSTTKAERWLLDLFNKHTTGYNKDGIYSIFLAIQQKNKSGNYVGSKRLEHMTTGFLELCWDKKETGKRYMEFSKNRKGKEKVKLYYSFAGAEGIKYDETRHSKELSILERLQSPDQFGIDPIGEIDFADLFKGDDDQFHV